MARFCDRLLELRNKKGITQQQLADILTKTGEAKITRSAVGMWESGKRMPKFETLETIADYFNVDLMYLRGRDRIAEEPIPRELEEQDERYEMLNMLFGQLSPKAQDFVIAQLRGLVLSQIDQGDPSESE